MNNGTRRSQMGHEILSSGGPVYLRSRACETLYNFDSRLWCEGPDYFTAFYEAVERNDAKKNDARIGENLGRMGQ